MAYLAAGEGRRMYGVTTPSEMPNKWAMSVRAPVGVVGVITPWNFPFAIPAWKLMPALVAGNTAVFKPAGDTPEMAWHFAKIFEEAGLPPGVLNLVFGVGPKVGQPDGRAPGRRRDLVHRLDRGRARQIAGARRGARQAHLARDGRQERDHRDGRRRPRRSRPRRSCGAPSAPPASAAPRAAACSCTSACTTSWSQRRRRSAPQRSGSATGSTRRPRSGRSSTGPGRDASTRYVKIGARRGRAGGGRRAGATEGALAKGIFYQPTVFAGVTPRDARIAVEEIFGPVLAMVTGEGPRGGGRGQQRVAATACRPRSSPPTSTARSPRCATSTPASST